MAPLRFVVLPPGTPPELAPFLAELFRRPGRTEIRIAELPVGTQQQLATSMGIEEWPPGAILTHEFTPVEEVDPDMLGEPLEVEIDADDVCPPRLQPTLMRAIDRQARVGESFLLEIARFQHVPKAPPTPRPRGSRPSARPRPRRRRPRTARAPPDDDDPDLPAKSSDRGLNPHESCGEAT